MQYLTLNDLLIIYLNIIARKFYLFQILKNILNIYNTGVYIYC